MLRLADQSAASAAGRGAPGGQTTQIWRTRHEISRYGTLKAWAEKLGLKQAVALLDETLQQEKKTDADLSKIAESAINTRAEAA